MKQIVFGVHLPVMAFSIDRCGISNRSVENTLTDAITVLTSLFGFKHMIQRKANLFRNQFY
jgi:hypothetical protein